MAQHIVSTVGTDDTWEMSKENVLPLKGGRSVKKISRPFGDVAIRTKEQDTIKEEYEAAVMDDESDDPLETWLSYISWSRQEFPDGNNCETLKLYERCARKFVDYEQYRNDTRYLRIWLNFADGAIDPVDIFKFLRSKNIGSTLTLFYEAYALALEIKGSKKQANQVYEEGIQRNVQPLERLKRRYREYQVRLTDDLKANMEAMTFGALAESNDGRRTLGRLSRTRNGLLPDVYDRSTQQQQHIRPIPTKSHLNAGGVTVFVDNEENEEPEENVGAWSHIPTTETQRKENTMAPGRWTDDRKEKLAAPVSVGYQKVDFPVFQDVVDDSTAKKVVNDVRIVDRGVLRSNDSRKRGEQLMENPLQNFKRSTRLHEQQSSLAKNNHNMKLNLIAEDGSEMCIEEMRARTAQYKYIHTPERESKRKFWNNHTIANKDSTCMDIDTDKYTETESLKRQKDDTHTQPIPRKALDFTTPSLAQLKTPISEPSNGDATKGISFAQSIYIEEDDRDAHPDNTMANLKRTKIDYEIANTNSSSSTSANTIVNSLSTHTNKVTHPPNMAARGLAHIEPTDREAISYASAISTKKDMQPSGEKGVSSRTDMYLGFKGGPLGFDVFTDNIEDEDDTSYDSVSKVISHAGERVDTGKGSINVGVPRGEDTGPLPVHPLNNTLSNADVDDDANVNTKISNVVGGGKSKVEVLSIVANVRNNIELPVETLDDSLAETDIHSSTHIISAQEIGEKHGVGHVATTVTTNNTNGNVDAVSSEYSNSVAQPHERVQPTGLNNSFENAKTDSNGDTVTGTTHTKPMIKPRRFHTFTANSHGGTTSTTASLSGDHSHVDVSHTCEVDKNADDDVTDATREDLFIHQEQNHDSEDEREYMKSGNQASPTITTKLATADLFDIFRSRPLPGDEDEDSNSLHGLPFALSADTEDIAETSERAVDIKTQDENHLGSIFSSRNSSEPRFKPQLSNEGFSIFQDPTMDIPNLLQSTTQHQERKHPQEGTQQYDSTGYSPPSTIEPSHEVNGTEVFEEKENDENEPQYSISERNHNDDAKYTVVRPNGFRMPIGEMKVISTDESEEIAEDGENAVLNMSEVSWAGSGRLTNADVLRQGGMASIAHTGASSNNSNRITYGDVLSSRALSMSSLAGAPVETFAIFTDGDCKNDNEIVGPLDVFKDDDEDDFEVFEDETATSPNPQCSLAAIGHIDTHSNTPTRANVHLKLEPPTRTLQHAQLNTNSYINVHSERIDDHNNSDRNNNANGGGEVLDGIHGTFMQRDRGSDLSLILETSREGEENTMDLNTEGDDTEHSDSSEHAPSFRIVGQIDTDKHPGLLKCPVSFESLSLLHCHVAAVVKNLDGYYESSVAVEIPFKFQVPGAHQLSNGDTVFIQNVLKAATGEDGQSTIMLVTPDDEDAPDITALLDDCSHSCGLVVSPSPNPWGFYLSRVFYARFEKCSHLQGTTRTTYKSIPWITSCHVHTNAHMYTLAQSDYYPLQTAIVAAHSNGELVEEPIVLFYAIEIFKAIEALHAQRIICNGICPDKILLRHPNIMSLSDEWEMNGSRGWDDQGVLLSDLSHGIDLTLFPPSTKFTGPMPRWGSIPNRDTWSVEVDLFDAANTIHKMIHCSGLALGQTGNEWGPSKSIPCTWNVALWNMVFKTLINFEEMEHTSYDCLKHLREQLESALHNDERARKRVKTLLLRQAIALFNK
eukprot:CFRG0248T1